MHFEAQFANALYGNIIKFYSNEHMHFEEFLNACIVCKEIRMQLFF